LFPEAESFHRRPGWLGKRSQGSAMGWDAEHRQRTDAAWRWQGADRAPAVLDTFWSRGMGLGREVQAHSFPIGGQSDQEFVAAGLQRRSK